MFVFIFVIYRFHAFVCMFILYAFVFIFVIVTTHCLHNVCICCIAIYLLMNLLYHIQLLYLIFVVATHEIFHIFVQCLSFDILYHHSHLFILDIFFILVFDYHSLDLLILMKLILKFSTMLLMIVVFHMICVVLICFSDMIHIVECVFSLSISFVRNNNF